MRTNANNFPLDYMSIFSFLGKSKYEKYFPVSAETTLLLAPLLSPVAP